LQKPLICQNNFNARADLHGQNQARVNHGHAVRYRPLPQRNQNISQIVPVKAAF
jgi:hypothetical protein